MTYQNQGAGRQFADEIDHIWTCGVAENLTALSSSFRTVTVGSGFSPDLLTSLHFGESARGLPGKTRIPPVGTFTPP